MFGFIGPFPQVCVPGRITVLLMRLYTTGLTEEQYWITVALETKFICGISGNTDQGENTDYCLGTEEYVFRSCKGSYLALCIPELGRVHLFFILS